MFAAVDSRQRLQLLLQARVKVLSSLAKLRGLPAAQSEAHAASPETLFLRRRASRGSIYVGTATTHIDACPHARCTPHTSLALAASHSAPRRADIHRLPPSRARSTASLTAALHRRN
jgi:hypothetical protein